MAENNNNNDNSKVDSFVNNVETDFDEQYLSGFPTWTHFVGLDRSIVERNNQTFHLVATEEPNVLLRDQSGLDHPIPRAEQIVSPNVNPQQLSYNNNETIASSKSSTTNNQSFPWTFESESSSSSMSSNKNGAINIHSLNSSDLLMAVSISNEENTSRIAKLALEAMDDLKRAALEPGEPLWRFDVDTDIYTLNSVEYAENFGNVKATFMEIDRLIKVDKFEPLPRLWPKNYSGYNSDESDDFFENLISDIDLHVPDQNRHPEENLFPEGSRFIGYVGMKPLDLVELLMDLEKWSQVFYDIVSVTKMIGVLASSGVQSDYEETLQVLRAELHFPSPLVPTRESFVARYCKRLDRDLWGIVDVSLESLFKFSASEEFWRRPSGCLIEQMPNGSSKVIWVENVAVDNRKVNGIFKETVSSGFAFSAKRWVESITRHCQRSSSPMDTTLNPCVNSAKVPEISRRSILKLSERMVRSFFRDVNGSTANEWKPLLPISINGRDHPRLISTKTFGNDNDKTKVTYFSASIGLQVPPRILIDYLSNVNYRPMWDIMWFGQQNSVNEMVRINTGNDPGNFVSLFRVKSTSRDSVASFFLQESYTNSTGSYVIYSGIDFEAAGKILDGGDSDAVVLRPPAGYSVHPDVAAMSKGVCYGSFVTVALHATDQSDLSLDNLLNNVLTNTLVSMKNAFPNYIVHE